MRRFVKYISLLIILLLGIALAGCRTEHFTPIAIMETPLPANTSPDLQETKTTAVTVTPSPLSSEVLVTAPSEVILATAQLQLPLLRKSEDLGKFNFTIAPQKLETRSSDGKFSLILQTPVIQSRSPERYTRFNLAIQDFIEEESGYFTSNIQGYTADFPGGYLISTYSIPSSPDWKFDPGYPNYQIPPLVADAQASAINPGHPVISTLINISEYFGGAHPHEHHYTLNYDLQTGRILTLDNLFKQKSNYLKTIAEISINQLKRDPNLFEEEIEFGAADRPENYTNWVITPQGLLIIFDEYQVGPYAAGPQYILIPYDQLSQIIAPDGAIGDYATGVP